MKIEPGYYIRKVIKIKSQSSDDEATESPSSEVNHYLILSVDDGQTDVMFFKGTPLFNSHVVDFDEISPLYNITEVPFNDVRITPIEKNRISNGLDSKYTVARKYEWNGKEFIDPVRHVYWNGSEWVDNSDFWERTEEISE